MQSLSLSSTFHGYTGRCGSYVLATPKSEGMDKQVDLRAEQTISLILAEQKYCQASGRWRKQSITELIARRKEKQRKEEQWKDLCPSTPKLVLFRGSLRVRMP